MITTVIAAVITAISQLCDILARQNNQKTTTECILLKSEFYRVWITSQFRIISKVIEEKENATLPILQSWKFKFTSFL